jgi:Ca2+-binding EF-hand superfamily protein
MMMIRTLSAIALTGLLAMPGVVMAQDADKKQEETAKDVLRDAVDPYAPGKERARFLKAAGVDTELSDQEFKANANQENPFVRSYDKWSAILIFDKNGDKKIDWFEANSYRRGLIGAVLKKYDKDTNRRLTGQERDQANKDLAAGKAPRPLKTAASTNTQPNLPDPGQRPRTDNPDREARREQMRDRFRRLQKGEITDEERKAAAGFLVQGRSRLIDRFDKNGDGVLDQAERAEAESNRRGRFILKADDLGMKHFDENGDGKLSDDEAAGLVKFGEDLAQMGAKWDVKFNDADGDGQVTREERQAMAGRMRMVGISMLPKAMKWADLDGSGDVSAEERQQIAKNVEKAIDGKVKQWTEDFDANGDGRLSVNERGALVEGMNSDIDKRYSRADKNGDGKLDNTEMASMLEELAGEFGVKPKE